MDELWMARAIELARKGWYTTHPNPRVGCVIVRDGRIVGRGQTQFGGRPHAERVALNDAGDRARGATLYVTLEPCCHWGRTPPCADAIIAVGVTTVHASLQDPDPRVNGGGFRKLGDAGIRVELGLGARAAQEIMKGFFHRIATGRPLLVIGERPQQPAMVPGRYDALIRSEAGRLRVLTRMRDGGIEADVMEGPRDAGAILDRLGKRGLTSVYIARDDPLSDAFHAVGGQLRGDMECHVAARLTHQVS